MAELKLIFTMDGTVVREATHDKDIQANNMGVTMLEMLAVELATMIVSATRKEEGIKSGYINASNN